MVTFCNTICDRFFKQIAMLNFSRRKYNDFYNKRVVKSVSSTDGINKKDYLHCSHCAIYIKKTLAVKSPKNNYLLCPCCGSTIGMRTKRLTKLVRRY